MGIQSAVMAKQFGENFQYGKRRISAMFNEEFNKLTFSQLMINNNNELKQLIPTMQESLQSMTPLVNTIIIEFARMFKLAVDSLPQAAGTILAPEGGTYAPTPGAGGLFPWADATHKGPVGGSPVTSDPTFYNTKNYANRKPPYTNWSDTFIEDEYRKIRNGSTMYEGQEDIIYYITLEWNYRHSLGKRPAEGLPPKPPLIENQIPVSPLKLTPEQEALATYTTKRDSLIINIVTPFNQKYQFKNPSLSSQAAAISQLEFQFTQAKDALKNFVTLSKNSQYASVKSQANTDYNNRIWLGNNNQWVYFNQ